MQQPRAKSSVRLELFVPPDCETGQFVTIRWPMDSQARLVITTPHGQRVEAGLGDAHVLQAPDQGLPTAGIFLPHRATGHFTKGLLAIAPTVTLDASSRAAPCGRWRIECVAGQDGNPQSVHFWISRVQRNPGAWRHDSQADFVDWDERHHPRRWQRLIESDAQSEGPIRREGSINGIATLQLPSGRWHKAGTRLAATPRLRQMQPLSIDPLTVLAADPLRVEPLGPAQPWSLRSRRCLPRVPLTIRS